MVPLLLLIGMQINRSRKEAHLPDVIAELSVAFRGKNSDFNSVAGFIGLMVLLLLLILPKLLVKSAKESKIPLSKRPNAIERK